MEQIVENKIKELKEELKECSNKYDVIAIEDEINLLESILAEASNKAAVEKETVYKIGDKFKRKDKADETYMLSQIDSNIVTMIGLNSGNRKSRSLRVENVDKINRHNLKYIWGIGEFEKIE